MVRRKPVTLSARRYALLPGDGQCDELVRGRVVREPRPGARHGRVAAAIASRLQDWVERTGAGVVYTCDTGFFLARDPDTVRGPDVAYVRRARHCTTGDESWFFEGTPDLAVEVLSPGNRRRAMDAKVRDYLAAGSAAVWVVDPRRGTIRVCRHAAQQILTREQMLTMPDVLPGFSMRVGDVFAWPWETRR